MSNDDLLRKLVELDSFEMDLARVDSLIIDLMRKRIELYEEIRLMKIKIREMEVVKDG